jgi:hypothetical protein
MDPLADAVAEHLDKSALAAMADADAVTLR